MAHILDLPKEIYIIIFNHLRYNVTQKEFYLSLSKVCRRWKDVTTDSLFWKVFDGSLSYPVLIHLSKEGYLYQTEELTFSNSDELKCSKQLERVLTGMPNLKFVNFSKVKLLREEVLSCLLRHCKKINSVKFSDDLGLPTYIISNVFLDNFLSLQAEMLLVIDLSNSKIRNVNQTFSLIAKYCKNLEELIVQNITTIGSFVFPLKVFQEGCRKIKVLRLGFPIYFSNHCRNTLPGFPNLEIFTHPNRENGRFFDTDFVNVLSKSPDLKILDIRGCLYISENAVLSLPATHLEHLYVSSTHLVAVKTLNEILIKWLRSLRVIDISKMKLEYVNEMLTNLCSKGKMMNLECLDLRNTKVNAGTIIRLIENCEKLHTLNLSSCRSVGRGFMREYCGKTDINKLYSKLLCHIES